MSTLTILTLSIKYDVPNNRPEMFAQYHRDIDAFYQEYSRIFDCGTYNNMKTGVFDLYGINYYAPALIDPISEKLNKEKPEEYEALAAWLSQAKAHNGFYIFGI